VDAPGASNYDRIYIEYTRAGDSVTLHTIFYAAETGPNSSATVLSFAYLNATVSIGALQSSTWTIPATASSDNIYGGPASDSISGGPSNDTVEGYSNADYLDGGLGNDSLIGGEGDDFIFGGAGDDRLYGQWGYDILVGGDGIDTAAYTSGYKNQYRVTPNQDGTITVTGVEWNAVYDHSDILSGIEYVSFHDGVFAIADLLPHTVSGTDGKDRLGGSDKANVIFGRVGNDTITAKGGNDLIYGGLGKDTLTGGKGQDVFIFDTKPGKANLDRIIDFSVKEDSIWLDNEVFAKLGSKGSIGAPEKLNKGYFTIGAKAKDRNDYVIYNNKTGVLSYDADGSGKDAALGFAQLNKGLALTFKDFFVV
jgi:serralysin